MQRDDRVSLRWFVEHRWRPLVEGNWGTTTAKSNRVFIRAVVDQFGDRILRELDAVELQKWINLLAAKYSRSMVNHVLTHLRAIGAEMVEQDFLAKDPARKLRRPKTRKPDGTVLAWAQYQSIIDAAESLRDQLIIKVACATAVRPGELAAFRWQSFERFPTGSFALRVSETVYKGKVRGWAKTESSEGYVPVPDRLAAELQQWRQRSQWPADEDFIFPNCQGGALCYENFSKRVLALIAIKLGLPKLTFQVLRRSYATRAVAEQKGSLKDVQAQLRHSRPDTTLQNYVKEVPESVFASVNRMYDSIAPALKD
ncbi:MAG: tyrosine-type recombinase/integrase [Acidobacteriales bacterium]|nr:tyrosine-type recombinase/integrase [Terriglobales bacterium]